MGASERAGSSLSVPRKLRGRTIGLWVAGSTAAGLGIGAGILLFMAGGAAGGSLMLMSVVFANVVGLVALLTVRFVLPRYSGFPAYVRFPMAVATLLGGAVLGSGLALLVNPLVVLYQVRLALMVVTVNGVLALVVGALTYVYEYMRSRIEDEAAARGRLEHEMSVARDIQMELLPKTFPNIPGLDVFGFTVPARHVGGDCYDVIDVGGGRLAITIGDVSGKGTPAAILMANVQAAVRALSESGVTPGRLIEKVNGLVYKFTEDSVFITFFYCVLDTRTGRLEYVNAGHNPPCVLRRDGEKDYLDRGGMVIGVMPEAAYEEGVVTLAAGDNLVLYTDGVTEAANPDEEMFGEERLEEVLARNRHASAREMEETVYSSIKDFTEGAAQTDDLTMVVVKMTTESADEESVPDAEVSRQATGGPSAARGAPATGNLRGPATADGRSSTDRICVGGRHPN